MLHAVLRQYAAIMLQLTASHLCTDTECSLSAPGSCSAVSGHWTAVVSAEVRCVHVKSNRWFAPSIKWLTKRRWHMPIGELWAVRVALRETRQGVFGLQNMLAQGFDAEMMQASGGPDCQLPWVLLSSRPPARAHSVGRVEGRA